MNRRRLIVLAVAACLGYAVWWACWRGDPRFVGRWQILDNTGGQNRKEIVFARNGTGERRGTNGRENWTAYEFDWWVDGHFCVLQEESPAIGAFDLRSRLKDLYWMLTGNSRRGIQRRLQFEELGQGRMRVWQVDGDNQKLGHVYEIVKLDD